MQIVNFRNGIEKKVLERSAVLFHKLAIRYSDTYYGHI